MNYRHAFHAGNFADLAKHAILTRLLRDLVVGPAPLTVIDTHAGAGIYDLQADASRRTGEAGAGIVRLLAAQDVPTAFADVVAAAGLDHPGQLRPSHFSKRVSATKVLTYDQLDRFLEPGELIAGTEDPRYKAAWRQARSGSFAPAK